jgi:hypothetical protein
MLKNGVIILTAMFLTACDQEPPEKTVWDEQLKTMDKAYEAEQQLLEGTERQRQAIEQQTQQ